MRRFYLAGSFIAMLLICSVAPPPLEAGSGGRFDKGEYVRGETFRGKFGGEMIIPQEFPSFLRMGFARTGAPSGAPNSSPYVSPACWYEEALNAQSTNIVLLKARSASFATDPNFAPLAGLYKPPQAPLTPAIFPYSLIAVPQDGQFRYQATYTPAVHLPANLALGCSNFLSFNHDSVPEATPESRDVNWDYRIGITDRHDMHEAKRNGDGWANDADQNPKTLDKEINRQQRISYTDTRWFERSLFWQSDTNHDREDWFAYFTRDTGVLHITLECGNGTWSTWDLRMRLYDYEGNEVGRTEGSSSQLSLSVPYVPTEGSVGEKGDLSAAWNAYRIQIYGTPKSMSHGSNVYFLPYRLKVVQIPR